MGISHYLLRSENCSETALKKKKVRYRGVPPEAQTPTNEAKITVPKRELFLTGISHYLLTSENCSETALKKK